MEAEGQGPTIHEQAEATQPEQLQLQTQMEHHQMQPQIEQMPLEGVQAYEQHMQGNEAHLQHPEAHMQGKFPMLLHTPANNNVLSLRYLPG